VDGQSRSRRSGAVRTAPTFEAALVLRVKIRDYPKCDPEDRRRKSAAGDALNKAMELFPLRVASVPQAGLKLMPARIDESFGLSAIIAELYDKNGERHARQMKMCASGECQRVFFDRSMPGTRRWRRSTLCGNRDKTRTYRQRRKQEAIPAAPLKNAKNKRTRPGTDEFDRWNQSYS
jgi:predicted RNA-binding Zn ribbon-like protein